MKLIVSDIDGTLLDPDGRLPEANRAALARAYARGVAVALATVRRRAASEPVVEQLGLPCLLICEAGAAIYDLERTLLRRLTIPLELARAVARMANQHGLPLLTTVEDENYRGPGWPPPHYADDGVDVADNLAPLDRPPTRLIVRGAAGAELVMRSFPDAPLRLVRHYLRDGTLFDVVITHQDATKEGALAFLGERIGVAPAEMRAVGDAEADIGMIRLAGVGVAVGDGQPPVRAAADWIAPPAGEAGVAAAVQRFVLNEAA
ncbi:MAG TPA: HAD family hydrolase [Roseiflexaceae bacterium]|nr:HAD family hydrolase [Roseiflexaceae bacterium]